MIKGFTIKCNECGEELLMKQGYKRYECDSKVFYYVMGDYPFSSVTFNCANCPKNEVEVET